MMIELDEQTERLLEERVSAGKYASTSEALNIAVKLLVEQEERDEKLNWLRAEIQKGIDDVEAGRVYPLDFEKILGNARKRLNG